MRDDDLSYAICHGGKNDESNWNCKKNRWPGTHRDPEGDPPHVTHQREWSAGDLHRQRGAGHPEKIFLLSTHKID